MKRDFKVKLEKSGVAIVYLFGSKATGRASPSSDIDIGVVLRTTPTGKDTRAIYNILYRLFSELYHQFKLDIVFLRTATLSLQYSAIKEGKVIFEQDPKFTADYENRVINQYLDFRPVLDFFDRVTMERYGKV